MKLKPHPLLIGQLVFPVRETSVIDLEYAKHLVDGQVVRG